MRILLAVHQFFPEFSAGTEVVTRNVALELKHRGHQVEIFTGFPGKSEIIPDEGRFDQYEYQGLLVHRFRHAFMPMGGQTNVIEQQQDNRLARRFFEQTLERFKPNVVHGFNLARLSASPVQACWARGIPFYFTATDFWLICPVSNLLLPGGRVCQGPRADSANCLRHLAVASNETPLRRVIYRMPDALVGTIGQLMSRGWLPGTPVTAAVTSLVNRQVLLRDRVAQMRGIVVPSRIMRDMLIGNGIDRAKLALLPNGVHVSHIERRADKGSHAELRVGFMGTLAAHKGPHVLIDAMRTLGSGSRVRAAIYGPAGASDQYVRQLHRRASGLGNVKFEGVFEQQRVGEALAQIDVLVVPSLWYENAPLVMYEAGAAGCAIVASDQPGMSELVEPGVNGLLFRAGNAGARAEILSELERDRSRVAEMGRQGRMPLSVEAHVDVLERFYQEA